jgi:hypothetical protein
MTGFLFMSPEHVAAMNELLAVDSDSLAECAKLPRPYWFVHELDDAGRTIWWSMEFNPDRGVSFSLSPPPEGAAADILMRGSYWEVVEATRRGKAGEQVPYPATMEGNPQAMVDITPAFEVAKRVATLEARFPRAETSPRS